MLIVLEGLDGAGKSTQVRLLRSYLEGICPKLEYIHFPRYEAGVYGNLIGRFLRGDFGSIDEVHPQLVALLFAEDRHGAAEGIKARLAERKTVLLDRYVYSNIAYQCSKLTDEQEVEQLRHWIFDTEYNVFKEPVPDLNIFLDVPIDFVEQNLSKQRQGDDRSYLAGAQDIHEASIAFQQKVRNMYLRQAEEDPSFKVLDCRDEDGKMADASVIFNKLKALVDEVL